MMIDCPHCATHYDLDSSELAVGGFIRCAHCRTMWTPEPPSADEMGQPGAGHRNAASNVIEAKFKPRAEPPPIIDGDVFYREITRPLAAPGEPETLEQLEALANNFLPVLASQTAIVIAVPTPEPSRSAPPLRLVSDPVTVQRARKHRWPWIAAALTASLAALFVWRVEVVRAVPQSAGLYAALRLPVNVRGLVFADVKTAQEKHEGADVLIVTGAITNTTAKPVEVPRLRLALLDAGGAEVFTWAAAPTKATLATGETLPFRSRLASPPSTVQDIQVRFFTRRDLPLAP